MAIQVDTQTLRGSAEMLSRASGRVRETQPDQHLSPAAGAISGGSSEQAARTLASDWSEAYTAWQRTARAHQDALEQAADSHDATDQGAARSFTPGTGGGGRIPR